MKIDFHQSWNIREMGTENLVECVCVQGTYADRHLLLTSNRRM